MEFQLLTTATLPLQPQLEWIWYSERSRSFIVGDERAAFALAVGASDPPQPLRPDHASDANDAKPHPCNLPISDALYEEFAQQPWHGFRFMERSAYDRVVDAAGHPKGDLLRTLVFRPNYGHYVCHPATNRVLSLQSGSMELLKRTPGGFELLDKTRTRGRAALTFGAHPSEPLLAYGDNFGTFHAHRFDPAQFGKAGKFAAKERNAARVEFVRSGEVLVLGGMGYLATYSYTGGKFSPGHEIAIPVRDFAWLNDGVTVLVNQGMHGVSAYRLGADGFQKLGAMKPEGTVKQISVSTCGQFLAATDQESATIRVFRIA